MTFPKPPIRSAAQVRRGQAQVVSKADTTEKCHPAQGRRAGTEGREAGASARRETMKDDNFWKMEDSKQALEKPEPASNAGTSVGQGDRREQLHTISVA